MGFKKGHSVYNILCVIFGSVDVILELRIDGIRSFVYNDSYGSYHCIFVDGSSGDGLWCERIDNGDDK